MAKPITLTVRILNPASGFSETHTISKRFSMMPGRSIDAPRCVIGGQQATVSP